MSAHIIRTAPLLVLLVLASCGLKTPPQLPEVERPAAPVNLLAVHREAEVILSWDYPRAKPGMLRDFHVYRSGELIASTIEHMYVDNDIEEGSTYEYVVVPRSAKGVLGEAEEVGVSPKAVPASPLGLNLEVSAKAVRLSWDHPEPGVFFNVYRSDSSGQYVLRPVNPEPISGTVFEDNPIIRGPVYYTVRAMRGGPSRHEGPASKEAVLSPEDFAPSAPETLRAVQAGNKVLLAWSPNPEIWVVLYKVYRALGGGEFELLGESRTPSFIDSDDIAGTRYYKVRAMGPSVEGPPSAVVEIAPK